jgi:hypothetical protein
MLPAYCYRNYSDVELCRLITIDPDNLNAVWVFQDRMLKIVEKLNVTLALNEQIQDQFKSAKDCVAGLLSDARSNVDSLAGLQDLLVEITEAEIEQ